MTKVTSCEHSSQHSSRCASRPSCTARAASPARRRSFSSRRRRSSRFAPAVCSTAAAGSMLSNQIILIRGDRIADVGPSVAIPADARVIDLSSATVMPGMIDAHVHVYPPDDLSAVHANHRRGGQRAGRSRGRLHHRPRHGFARRLRHRRSPQRHQSRRGARAANAGRRAVAQSARRQTVPVVLRALPGSLHREQEPELTVARRARRCARPSCTAPTG